MKTKKIGARYRFNYTDYGSPPCYPDLVAHSGQQVTLIEKVSGDNCLYSILADDDWIGPARADELRIVNNPKPYRTLRDKAMGLLTKIGVENVHFHYEALGEVKYSIIPRTDFSGSLPAEAVAVGAPRGWRWTPRIRYVHVMGPNLRTGTDTQPFWYVTSNLEGSITRGDRKDDWKAKNIFAHGATSLEAVKLWISNYVNRKYNERT